MYAKFLCTALLTSLGLTAAVAQSSQTISGIVFEDKNTNGLFDAKEKGVAQVPVSNGKDVVLTDVYGKYTLPIGNDDIIFVVKPTGYKIPLDTFGLPKSYALHKPNGTPSDFKYAGAKTSLDLSKSLNFALQKQVESNEYEVLLFGDPQPYSEKELDYFKKGIVVEAKQRKSAAFGISLGDLVGDHLTLHEPYKNIMKDMGMPWYNVMGNHDMNYEATADSLSDETFEKNFGPANYSFNYGNAHYIVLDNILYPDPRDNKGYWGGFRKDQLTFLENNLKHVPKNKLVVVSFHIPIFLAGVDEFILEHRQALFDLLEGYENVLALSAHTHFQKFTYFTKSEGWRNINPLVEYNVGTTSGDWYSGAMNAQGVPQSTMRDGTPKGYAIMTVKGNQYDLQYKVAGESEQYQINITAPKVVKHGVRVSAPIVANFFMGHSSNTVEYRIGNGAWKLMKHKIQADPSYTYKVLSYDFADRLLEGKRPSNPEMSEHLWYGGIPNNLALGEHVIEIRAKDMFGKLFTEKTTIKVVN